MAQTVSATAMALGHGLQDVPKSAAVIALALTAAGSAPEGIPLPARVGAAVAMAAGTYAGGWRIVRTVGQRLVPLDPARGFVAEVVASGVLYAVTFALRAPISTTHVTVAAVVGAGGAGRPGAVRWRTVRSVGVAWLLTPPAAALLAAAVHVPGAALLG
jgi:PiT family inorganic phosphate transporter